jgi:ABC-2 type transport system permease protein
MTTSGVPELAPARKFSTFRALWATAGISARMTPRDAGFVVIGALVRVLTFGVLAGVWRGLPEESLAATGSTVAGLIAYSAVAQAITPLLNPRTSLGEYIVSGSLIVRMGWPIPIAPVFFAEWIGSVAISTMAGAAGIIAVASLAGADLAAQGDPVVIAISLALAIGVGLLVDCAFAMLTMWLNNGIWFVSAIRAACTGLLSGAIVPLQLMPEGVAGVLQYLPFASMAFGPLQIYTGSGDTIRILLTQLIWLCVLLVALALFVPRTRDHIVSAGG